MFEELVRDVHGMWFHYENGRLLHLSWNEGQMTRELKLTSGQIGAVSTWLNRRPPPPEEVAAQVIATWNEEAKTTSSDLAKHIAAAIAAERAREVSE